MDNDLIKQIELIESTISDMNLDRYNAMIIYDMNQYLQSYLRDIISILKQYENKIVQCGKDILIIDKIVYTPFGLQIRVIDNNNDLRIYTKHNLSNFEIIEE